MRRLGGTALLAVVLTALLGVASAQAAVTYGSAGEFGKGDLVRISGIAVDSASGNVLAVDSGGNRIRVYDPAGSAATLLMSFGAGELTAPEDIAIDQSNGDAYVTNPDADETQAIRMFNASGGTFTLGFEGQSTDPIAFGAGASGVREALEGLPGIGTGDVRAEGTGEDRVLTFTGTLTETDVEQLTIDGSGLEVKAPILGPVLASVKTVRNGAFGKIVRFVPDNRANPTSYTADPSFPSPVGGSKAGLGQIGSFGSPIAVDPGSADLLIGDNGNRRVARFSSSGEFLGSFSSAGSPSGPTTSFLDLTVVPGGQIYMIRDATVSGEGEVVGAKVERSAPDGSGVTRIGGPELDSARSLAFDPASGNLVVASGGWFVEPPRYPRLNVYHDGALIEQVQYPTQFEFAVPPSLAVDSGQSGRLYAAVGRVYEVAVPSVAVFSPLSVPVLAAPSAVRAIGAGHATAHLSGSVDPIGRSAKYHFEYAADGDAGWTATPELDAGSGTGPVAVEADIALAVGTTYKARLVVSSYGARIASAAQAFSTPGVPLVATSRADHLGPVSATLHGLLNPRGLASSFRFEYGTDTGYGSTSPPVSPAAPGGEGETLIAVTQFTAGLQPATTYHYRIVVETIAGTTAGEDETFTTQALDAGRSVSRVAAGPESGTAARKRCGKGRHWRHIDGKRRCVKPHKKPRQRR